MKKQLLSLMLIATLPVLSGCAIGSNRIAVTLAGDECIVNSQYDIAGRKIGLATGIDPKDCEALKRAFTQ